MVQWYSPGGACVHPHLIHASLGRPESKTRTGSRSVQPFLHSARHRVAILYNQPPISPWNCPCPWKIWTLIHGSFSPPESSAQMVHWSVQLFCRAHGSVSLYFTTGSLYCQLPLAMKGSEPPSNTWFLGPMWAHNPNSISIGSAVFAGFTTAKRLVTLSTYRSYTNNCIYLSIYPGSLPAQHLRSQAFSVAGPTVWNSLPDFIRDLIISADCVCLKPNSITLSGSKLVADRFKAGSTLVADLQRAGIWPII